MKRSLVIAWAVIAWSCGTDDGPGEPMSISVFKLEPAAACRGKLAGSDPLEIKPSFTLCKDIASGGIIAGSDQLTLVIDYGSLEFTEGTVVPSPTVTLTVDDTPVTASVAIVPHRDTPATHVFFEATFTAPARPGSQLGITAEAATGYSRTVATTFSLVAPALSVSIEQCLATPCTLTAAVDNAAVHVVAATTAPQTATLVSIVDGASQSAPLTVPLASPLPDNRIEGVAFLPVPAGSKWQLQASINATQASFGPIALTPPIVSGTLGCGTTCNAGAQTTFTLSAPRHVHPATGTVNVTVDNAPLISSGSVTLNAEDVPDDLLSGSMTITFPSAPGKAVVITASVAGYPITTISTTLR